MLLALALIACNGDSDTTAPTTTDTVQIGTETRPPVEAVDSAALDTGHTGTITDTDTDTTGTPTGDTGTTEPIDTGIHVLEGRAFIFNPANATVAAGPVGLNIFASVYMIEVLDVNTITGTTTMRVAGTTNAGSQAMCVPTADIEADFSADPLLTFGPVDGNLGLWGKRTPIEQASGSILFDSLYERIDNASLAALYDINNFADYYYGSGFGSYLCSVFGYYGGGCTTCPASGSTECLGISGSGMVGRWEPALSLTERTQADIQADPSCN